MPVDYQISEGIARYFNPGESYGDPFIASAIIKHLGRDAAVIEAANGTVTMPDTVELFKTLKGYGIKTVCMTRAGFPFSKEIIGGVLDGYIEVDVDEFIFKMTARLAERGRMKMRVGDKPAWITEAEKYIGEKEIPGKGNNPLILQWWKAIKRGGIKLDSVPWCAGFTGACFEESGIVSTRFESAKSYLQWGVMLTAPKFGCVVVFERDGGGHVGFVVGKTADGRLLVLGGNQADKVSIAPFKTDRVAGYRWPKNIPFPKSEIPVLANTEPTSTNEA